MKRCLSLLLMSVAVVPQVAQAQFQDLVGRIPGRANAIVVLNVDKIYASPLAQSENWREQQEKAFAAGLTVLPPQAQQFIMAAKMDFEFMQPSWEVGLANVSYEPSMPKVAAKWNGELDRIGKRNAVVLPSDTYVVQFGKAMVGVMRPANRQNVAHWLGRIDSSGAKSTLSRYLTEAVGFAQQRGTPIIMALDLEHAISPERIRSRVEASQFVEGANLDIDRLVAAIGTIKGITLGITIRDRVFGSVKVDFGENIEFMKEIAKPMLLEALAANSAMIDEFEDWKPQVEGKQIRISGPLYRSGVQRILSVLDAPESLQQVAAETNQTPQSDENMKRLASQQYFKTVTGQVDDLRGKDKQTLGQVGIWCGRYARKIDKLPLLNVDEELLDYGSFVASALREAEAVLRGVGGRSRVRQQGASGYGGTGYNNGYAGRWGTYGSYGYGGVRGAARAEQQARVQVRTQERVAGASSGRQIMQQIDAATAEVRRKMTEKYQSEF